MAAENTFDDKAATWDQNPGHQQSTSIAAEALKGSGLLHPGSTAVLDLGCGTGLLAEKIADSLGALVGVDTSPGMIAAFQRKAEARGDGKLRCVLAELTGPESLTSSTPADGGAAVPEQYDLAISLMTFHHIQDIAGTLRLLKHHLKPGGSVAIFDLLATPASIRFHSPAHSHGLFHRGGFSLQEMEQHLTEAGYTAVEARAVGSLQKAAFDGEGEMLEFQLFMATATAG
ncbi:hypothetical protein CHLNCDRAFT_134986 [Chlorella variabilis]|uniref:Methyltransferase domain-containing protein n=1 Tax=Chlorella variabilis TaxID=554065 RepID=E1ZHA3_CHLVA|nr:hypothetical protein CHLNCDRAFT_134986 [Chlorella variabilis]EFN54882.1 hypothetical protein CHLNCDRAFT_134986 [Chlorella variabilis]|eukprot:XP_005846984.1 hypothetical protein CHLNCDRAFT_134986 [Chlorella variabilis]